MSLLVKKTFEIKELHTCEINCSLLNARYFHLPEIIIKQYNNERVCKGLTTNSKQENTYFSMCSVKKKKILYARSKLRTTKNALMKENNFTLKMHLMSLLISLALITKMQIIAQSMKERIPRMRMDFLFSLFGI